MHLNEAIKLISGGVDRITATWADIGAGTGIFTEALEQLLLPDSTIYALDKSPHALFRSALSRRKNIHIREGDFNLPLNLPVLDGILMANTLHYAADPGPPLANLLQHLRPGGTFLLVEYELERPIPTWVPYPISFRKFADLTKGTNLSEPQEIGRTPSVYGHQYIYAAVSRKQE